ncbi:hypothetical protein DPMN_087186 [Dreissena polymorpha]|uniref:Uncharacterized protein n=1 Tax=Dreissena polymorpha TaxID=45954 RepID=A0A9D4QWN3_DREPO|nr:hypothetical protein DPMN_087186 [Dreissena polymorpha]
MQSRTSRDDLMEVSLKSTLDVLGKLFLGSDQWLVMSIVAINMTQRAKSRKNIFAKLSALPWQSNFVLLRAARHELSLNCLPPHIIRSH